MLLIAKLLPAEHVCRCRTRMACAALPATKTIRDLCRSELERTSRTGTFDVEPAEHGSLLWGIVTMISKFHHAETQTEEGLNSIVKLIGRRCPNTCLELLSSRLVHQTHYRAVRGDYGMSETLEHSEVTYGRPRC